MMLSNVIRASGVFLCDEVANSFRQMFCRLHLCILYFALCGFLPGADNPLKIELVSEVTSIVPGKPFYVGLHLQHQPGDHTYWRFPGIVGVPTGIKWELPEGFKAGPIEWPEPQR